MTPLTANDMEILKALWRGGPLSARETHAAIGQARGWSYSTTRTLLARMVDKGLVARGESHGLAVFSAAIGKTEAMSRLIRAFSAQMFDLDAPLPASAFADSPLLDEAELAELEAMLAEPEDKA